MCRLETPSQSTVYLLNMEKDVCSTVQVECAVSVRAGVVMGQQQQYYLISKRIDLPKFTAYDYITGDVSDTQLPDASVSFSTTRLPSHVSILMNMSWP